MSTRVYITNFNNLERGFRQLVEWLQASGCDITVIDNASTWEPLREFYMGEYFNPVFKQHDHRSIKVLHQPENLGPYAFWELGLHKVQTERFIVTDPDVVPSKGCPAASWTIGWMNYIMDKYQAGKVGPSLDITNLPDHYKYSKAVRDWELQFWLHITDDLDAFHADIDTTFAMYEPGSYVRNAKPCLRLAPPYTFEHVPWYEDSSAPNAERDYYLAHIRKDWTDWSKR